jgi:hypothetical protein
MEAVMKVRLDFRVFLPALVFILFGSIVYAGDLAVTMKQPFKAGGKDYPAGRYVIIAEEDGDHVILMSPDRNTRDKIPASTRLSPREGQWGKVVFDKIDNSLYLAEIYIVGMDGFFFKGAPGKHKHLVVNEDLK